MNKHITKEFYENCKKCKELCKEFIERSKELLRSCEFVTIPAECTIDINKVMLVSDDLLDACQKCMDYANVYKQNCKDEKCKHIYDDIIFACKECIKALGNVEIECEHDLKPCTDAVETAIDKVEECINEIDKLIESTEIK